MTPLEPSHILISNFHPFDFHFAKILLVTKIFFLFISSTITSIFGSWTFIWILLTLLWSILKILRQTFKTFSSWLVILIFETVSGTLLFLITLPLMIILLSYLTSSTWICQVQLTKFPPDIQIPLVSQTWLSIWCSYKVDCLNLIITQSILIGDSPLIMFPSQSPFPLWKKISTHLSSLLQRTVKKKHRSSKMSHLLSRILTSPTYLISTNLKMLLTHLLQILNTYGGRIPSSSILQDILRAGGMRNIIDPWETIRHQEILKTRRSLRK